MSLSVGAQPADSTFLRANLEAIARAGGPARAVAAALQGTAVAALRLHPGHSVPTAELQAPTGEWVRVHSARAPHEEAARLLGKGLAGRPLPRLVAVVGAGLGWILEELERQDSDVKVIVFDPRPELSLLWLSRRDWSRWFDEGRLALVTGPDYVGLSRLWPMVVPGERPAVVATPTLVRLLPDECTSARKALERLLYGAEENARARRRFGPRHLAATLENLPHVLVEGDVTTLEGIAAGRPAIVIGAGPSLNTNASDLFRARDRALLVAADTALRPLLAHGVRPHIVVCLDPSEENATHLQNLPACRDVWLVAEAGVSPSALGAFEGRTFFFRVSDAPPWPWLAQQGIGLGRLSAWGSVVTAAFDLVLRMGSRTVLFAGLDLAYSDGLPYCRHSTFEERWAHWAALGDSLATQWAHCMSPDKPRVPDVGGGETTTTTTLIEFRDWLVEQTAVHENVRFVNATGRGILRGGRIVERGIEEELRDCQATPAPDMARSWAAARDARPLALRLLQSLAAISEGRLPVEWAEFTEGDARSNAEHAVQAALRGLQHLGPGTPPSYAAVPSPPSVEYPVPLADAMDRLAALLSGRASEARAVVGRHQRADALERLSAARKMLRDLASRELEIRRANDAGSPDVPAGFAFEWPAGLRDDVWNFERCVCEALDAAPPSVDQSAIAWLGAPAVAFGMPASAGAVPWRARLASEFALAMAHVLRATDRRPDSNGARDWAETASLLRSPGFSQGEADALADRVARGDAWDAPVEPGRSARARTGRLSSRSARLPSLIRPAVLTWRRLPKGIRTFSAGNDDAWFTPWRHPRSYRVDERGQVNALPAWPEEIDAEMPWGTAGGGIAYSERARRVLFRTSAGDPGGSASVPFTPVGIAMTPDGRVWWAAREGGLWEGHPALGSIEKRLDTSPLLGLFSHAGDLQLVPGFYPTGAGVVRRVERESWRVRASGGQMEAMANGALAQPESASESAGWSATAYPLADAVVLRNDGRGREWTLAVYHPVSVAWAGTSLLVACDDGHLLFFGRVVTRLRE